MTIEYYVPVEIEFETPPTERLVIVEYKGVKVFYYPETKCIKPIYLDEAFPEHED